MPRFVFALIALLMSMTATAKSIVVLGDSISAGHGIEVAQGWVALLQNKMNDKSIDYIVHNESISGDTTAGGLARIDQALTLRKPDIVIIERGANDGLRGLPPELIKSNLAEIVHRVQQANAKGARRPQQPAIPSTRIGRMWPRISIGFSHSAAATANRRPMAI